MWIAVDASRATISHRTGTEGYSLHIIRGLIEAAEANDRFTLYFRDEPLPELFSGGDNVEIQVIHQPRLWTHRGIGPVVRRQRPDVMFVPSHVVPWPGTGSVPSVVTIHDLGYLHFPDRHPVPERLYLGWSTRHSTGVARRVIAVSQATAHDLNVLLAIPREKTRVVYSGVDRSLHPVDNRKQIEMVQRRLGIDGPYVLHIGRVQARKNLVRLVEAFAAVRDVVPNLKLVLAGRSDWGSDAVSEQIGALKLSDHVILPGYVPDDDLAALYSGALVYAFPSLYEGFGFPALEAMACGTPVLCANTSSLPELVGDAAFMVVPTDVDAWVDALRRLLTDEMLRNTLTARGFERVRQFTWEACARETLAVLREAATM